ncbi:MAG TPA: TlpA disulfide reductase family protein [Terriglobales bacterium]|jgi:peroxiredoxin
MLSAQRLTFLFLLIGAVVLASSSVGETTGNSVWSKFEATMHGPLALHQEFEVERRVKLGYVDQVQRYQLVVDFLQGMWREQRIGGGDGLNRVFNGQDLFEFVPGGSEFTHKKQASNKDELLPEPFETKLNWKKAKEVQSLPCGYSGKDHGCVVVDVPIKPWIRPGPTGSVITMTGGTSRIMIDAETGVWLRCHTVALVESSHGSSQWDVIYTIKQMSFGAAPAAALFQLPTGLHEVQQFTPWDEGSIKKQLAGKPAPDLQIKDIHGNSISLAAFKGKTVLLDFWTTWCPSCQSDASSIEKLNQKYCDKSLAIVGISVGEERETVEKYLKKHPHNFPVVLSSENQMPLQYQIHVFPTYLIIGPDGNLMTVEQGDQGFAKLRNDLKKAGLETD